MLRVSRRLDFAFQYGDIKIVPYSSPEIRDINLTLKDPSGYVPLLKIPKITFDYSIDLSRPPSVTLHGLYLHSPQVTVYIDPDIGREQLMVIAEESREAYAKLKNNLGKWLKVDPSFKIAWIDAKVKATHRDYPHVIESPFNGYVTFNLEANEVDLDLVFVRADEQLDLKIQTDFTDLDLTFIAKNIRLNSYASEFPDYLLINQDTTLDGACTFHNPSSKNIVFETSHLKLKNFGFEHFRVADHPINNIVLGLDGRVEWDINQGKINLQALKLSSQSDASIKFDGALSYKNPLAVDLQVSMEETPIQDFLDAFPRGFIPKIHQAKVEGTLAFKINTKLDLSDPEALIFDPTIEIEGYRLTKEPPEVGIQRLKGEFTHVAHKKGEVAKEFVVGASNRNFASYGRLGRNIIRGVLTNEDGRFFKHGGFQLKHIRASMIQNIKEKRFARGASTISMQLAKNLFLTGTKNVARKFQEMLITYALEQELDKERMLEIYMNIIEWGPKIYGIGSASRHYFYKSPSGLSPMEAAFLGSIIANPVKYHYMYSRGDVGDQWAGYLEKIVRLMRVEYIDEEPRPVFGWVRRQREEEMWDSDAYDWKMETGN